MAYLDLHDTFSRATAEPARELDQRADFTPLEWNVIALSRQSGFASLSRPGRISRMLGRLFGTGTSTPLADPKLEALRRFSVHAWHRGYALPVSQFDAFVGAGFTTDQAETLLASISGARADRGWAA